LFIAQIAAGNRLSEKIPGEGQILFRTGNFALRSAGQQIDHHAARTRSGVRREHRKESVDQIAAAMILQGYLDHLSMTKKEDGENNG